MSIIAKHPTHNTWVIILNIVFDLMLAWDWYCYVLVQLVEQEGDSCSIDFSMGVFLLVAVGSSSIALVLLVRIIVCIPLLLIARTKLDHIDPGLVGGPKRHFFLLCKGLMVWKRVGLVGIHGFPPI